MAGCPFASKVDYFRLGILCQALKTKDLFIVQLTTLIPIRAIPAYLREGRSDCKSL